MLSIEFNITFSENVSSFTGETVKVEMKCATNVNRVTDEEAVLEWYISHSFHQRPECQLNTTIAAT